MVVTAEIKALLPIDSDKVDALETQLPNPPGAKLELVVNTILTRHSTVPARSAEKPLPSNSPHPSQSK